MPLVVLEGDQPFKDPHPMCWDWYPDAGGGLTVRPWQEAQMALDGCICSVRNRQPASAHRIFCPVRQNYIRELAEIGVEWP